MTDTPLAASRNVAELPRPSLVFVLHHPEMVAPAREVRFHAYDGTYGSFGSA